MTTKDAFDSSVSTFVVALRAWPKDHSVDLVTPAASLKVVADTFNKETNADRIQ